MTFRDILVPLDGSLFAESALPLGAWLAKSSKAKLHLATVHHPAAVLMGMGEGFAPPDFDEDARAREIAYLAERQSELLQQGVSGVESHNVDGPTGPALCEEVTRVDADLVVMATHGRGSVGRFWLGSVADHLLRRLSIPMLLVHPNRQERPLGEPLRSVLVALDLSNDAEAILEPAIALAQLESGHLTLIHVIEPVLGAAGLPVEMAVITPTELQESRTLAQRYLDRIADRLRLRGLSVSTKVLSGAGAAAALLLEHARNQYDVLALTTHGRGGLRRLFLGSVADKVIRGAMKPVLVLRPLATV